MAKKLSTKKATKKVAKKTTKKVTKKATKKVAKKATKKVTKKATKKVTKKVPKKVPTPKKPTPVGAKNSKAKKKPLQPAKAGGALDFLFGKKKDKPAPKPTPTSPGSTALVKHSVRASSFADLADIAAFKACKALGKTDEECFKVGDNGIGFTGANCAGPTPMCALPPDDWKARWGTKAKASLKEVVVEANGHRIVCQLGDTMPAKANIQNGAGIDLSPAAVSAIGKSPPIMLDAVWWWKDDE